MLVSMLAVTATSFAITPADSTAIQDAVKIGVKSALDNLPKTGLSGLISVAVLLIVSAVTGIVIHKFGHKSGVKSVTDKK